MSGWVRSIVEHKKDIVIVTQTLISEILCVMKITLSENKDA